MAEEKLKFHPTKAALTLDNLAPWDILRLKNTLEQQEIRAKFTAPRANLDSTSRRIMANGVPEHLRIPTLMAAMKHAPQHIHRIGDKGILKSPARPRKPPEKSSIRN